MTLEEYNKRSIPRLALIDRLDKKCQWDKFDFQVSREVRELRIRRERLMDEQMKDEIEMGF